MKSRLALAILLTCIPIGAAAAYYLQATSGILNYGSFTLTLTGYGYDRWQNEHAVSITLTGIRGGNLTKVVTLRVKGGNVAVEGLQNFAVTAGIATLIQRFNQIWLIIRITRNVYLGYISFWYLRGETGTLSGNDLPVSFHAGHAILPVTRGPGLYDLSLEGTLTLN